MTASRLVALTLGELRSTSDTSDLDTPARAATVSRVGFRAARPWVATRPLLSRLGLERSNTKGWGNGCQRAGRGLCRAAGAGFVSHDWPGRRTVGANLDYSLS